MCTENSKLIPAKDDVAPYVPWAPLFLKGKGFFKKASIAPGSALGDGPSHTHHLRPKLLSVFPIDTVPFAEVSVLRRPNKTDTPTYTSQSIDGAGVSEDCVLL